MEKVPWEPKLYGERDREAAQLCRALVSELGYTPRLGHPLLDGYGGLFIGVLADFGWLLPYAEEVSDQFKANAGTGDEGWRLGVEASFKWEASITLAAAGLDPSSLSVTVHESKGIDIPKRGKFTYKGRSGAFRVGHWGGGAGIEFAMQLGLPGHSVARLTGAVDGALSRVGRVCLPECVVDSLCRKGLLEFRPPSGHSFNEEEEYARHNRVGYWCGVASRTTVTHVKLSWKDAA